ncbi:MAG: hypothetical protein AAGE52_19125 [Myxococcota bacterium]
MGLFGKLFGGKSPEDRKARAERLMDDGDFGSAKIELERAIEGASGDLKADLQERIDECCNEIALGRVDEARRLIRQGDLDLARQELTGALEVAVSTDVRETAQSVVDELERDDAVELANVTDDVTDEERWVLISGSWEGPQADEYDEYGDTFADGILAVHDGRAEEGLALLEKVLEGADAPRYLWLEVGRARLVTGDRDGGRDALVEFVDSLSDDEVGEPLLAAYIELASIAQEDGEFEEAMSFYERAVDEFEQDHRPYFVMGVFLRDHDHLQEGIEVLEAGATLMDDIRPDWVVFQELGHAYAMAERDQEAIAQLEAVISFMTSRNILDFPPRSARKLAELHEKVGKLDRAADLYAQLAKGSDRDNHALYYREAGRLLGELGLEDESKRLLKRARALDEAEDDAESRDEDDAGRSEEE